MSPVEPLDCKEAFRSIQDYLDRELTAQETERVRAHLAYCAVCLREFRFEGQVLADFRAKLQRVAAPPDLVASVRSALQGHGPDAEPDRGH